MNRTLYLLVTSDRPDVYINSVVHCLLYEGVKNVEFIHIRDFGDKKAAPEVGKGARSAKVWGWVHGMLNDLAGAGEYRYFEGERAGTRVNLSQIYPPEAFASMKELYSHCMSLDVQWSHRDIPYSSLRKEIKVIANKKPAAIVDVSAVKKIFIGDLVAASVLEGLDSLFTFDLAKSPDFNHPWTTLFHELKASSAGEPRYRYINLLDTQVFRECSRSLLVKRPPLYISITLGFFLLCGIFLADRVFGAPSGIVQGMFITASVASFLSLFYVYFPFRG